MSKKSKEFDPDVGRRDDSSYWAAALVLAIKSGNRNNELSARANLRRLGFDVVAYETEGAERTVGVRLMQRSNNSMAAPGVDSKGGAV